jgi:hypothetical protein
MRRSAMKNDRALRARMKNEVAASPHAPSFFITRSDHSA